MQVQLAESSLLFELLRVGFSSCRFCRLEVFEVHPYPAVGQRSAGVPEARQRRHVLREDRLVELNPVSDVVVEPDAHLVGVPLQLGELVDLLIMAGLHLGSGIRRSW